MSPLEPDLGVGETQGCEPGGRVRLVPAVVSRLLCRRPVVAKTVGLDHEAELGPVEVHPEAVQHPACLGSGKSGSARDRNKPTFEFRVGEDKGSRIQHAPQRRDAMLPLHLFERRPQCLRIDEVPLVGFVHGRLDLRSAEAGGQIGKRSNGARDRDAATKSPILGR
jgi:hypothetical protein